LLMQKDLRRFAINNFLLALHVGVTFV